MAKQFKLKLSRVIPTFHSCRSKDPATLPSNPVPSFLRHPSPVGPQPVLPPPPPKSHHRHSSFKRHVSSAFTSMGCGVGSKSETDHTRSPPTPEFQWEKQDQWHIIAKIFDESPRRKIYNSSASETDTILIPPPPPPNTVEKKKRRVKKKKTTPRRYRISTSSNDSGLFSSEGLDDAVSRNEETETLISTDSSSRESPLVVRGRRKKASKRCGSKARKSIGGCSGGEGGIFSPARLSRFQWMIPCTVEGKVRESFAVVKKSAEPYEDFKRSMMEMIMEKEMFEEEDLEQLLHCFLSLNSRNHHGVIVEAFSEIWESLFCTRSSSIRVSTAMSC